MKTEKNEFSLVVRASAGKSRPVQLLYSPQMGEGNVWERVEIGISRVFKDICIADWLDF